MKFKSEIVTQASGSIGGTTYSHNRGGMYRRARSIPTNPATSNQQLVRTIFTALVNSWTSVLTGVARAGWKTYAANVPYTDTLGDELILTGQQMYVACNSPRSQAAIKLGVTAPLVSTAPTIYNRGQFTDPVPTWTETSGLSLAFTADAWVDEDNSLMLLYQSRPQNSSREFYKGPWRLIGAIEGNSTTAPTSPTVFAPSVLSTQGYGVAEDSAYWLKVRVSRADGRLSSEAVIGPEIAGA